MSSRRLDNWLVAYERYTRNTEPADSFRIWVGISTIAAALRRKVFVDWGHLTFYPNMYIVLTGPSASRKTTAMLPASELLRDIGVPLAADATTRQALIRRLRQSTNHEIDPETGIVNPHSSLTVISKELTVFLGYGDLELVSHLCDWYDCDPRWVYDTKGSGTDEVIGVWVNILGATTPDLLQASLPLGAIGGGLTSRMIFVHESTKGKTVACPFLTEDEEALRADLVHDLEIISNYSGKVRFTEDFLAMWIDWYTKESNNESSCAITDKRFEGYIDRRPTHLMKLSMIFAASRKDFFDESNRSLVMTCDDFQQARTVLQSIEPKMSQVFGGLGKSPVSDLVNRLMQDIGLSKEMDYSKLMSKYRLDADRFTLDKALEVLVAMNYAKIVHTQEGKVVKYVG